MKKEKITIEQLELLARGRIRGIRKKELLNRIESDQQLRQTYELVCGLSKMQGENQKAGLTDSFRTLSRQMFLDFRARTGDPKHGIIVFDSQNIPYPEGVRPAVVDTRRLRFKLDRGEIELSFYPVTHNAFEVVGQLSRDGLTDKTKVQLAGKPGRKQTLADEFGLFRFELIPSGQYCLTALGTEGIIGKIEFDL